MKKLFDDSEFWKGRVLLKSGVNEDIKERVWSRVYYGLQDDILEKNVDTIHFLLYHFKLTREDIKDYFGWLCKEDKEIETAVDLCKSLKLNDAERNVERVLVFTRILSNDSRNIMRTCINRDVLGGIETDISLIKMYVPLRKDIARDVLDNPKLSQANYEDVLLHVVTRCNELAVLNLLGCEKTEFILNVRPLFSTNTTKKIESILSNKLCI